MKKYQRGFFRLEHFLTKAVRTFIGIVHGKGIGKIALPQLHRLLTQI
jgi:hypothetical protein